eukprot:COSAG01_NODE_8093_length_2924_cov_4.376991_6_plen_47_part_01
MLASIKHTYAKSGRQHDSQSLCQYQSTATPNVIIFHLSIAIVSDLVT